MLNRIFRFFPAMLLSAAVALHAADKARPTVTASIDPYAEVQSTTESLDLNMYQRIREEGLNHSHVMEFATALMDGMGPRLAPLKDIGVATITNRNTGGTDHLSIDAVGIPGFQFIQDDLDYESRTHHSNEDVAERLQPSNLKQIATVETIFVYNAAQRDQMMPRKPLPAPDQPPPDAPPG